MIVDAITSLRMNYQAAVYINDEKNAGEPANLSIPIPAIHLIPERHHPGSTRVREKIGLLAMSFSLCIQC